MYLWKIGAEIKVPNNNIGVHEYLFGEDQSRYLVEVSEKNKDEVIKIIEKSGIYYDILGKTQKDSLNLNKEFNITIDELTESSLFWFKNYFKESY